MQEQRADRHLRANRNSHNTLPLNITNQRSKPFKKVKSKDTSQINTLLHRSDTKPKHRQVIVEEPSDGPENEEDKPEFFCFGRGKWSAKWEHEPRMEAIKEVPDTVSNSQRYTEQSGQKKRKDENWDPNCLKSYGGKKRSEGKYASARQAAQTFQTQDKLNWNEVSCSQLHPRRNLNVAMKGGKKSKQKEALKRKSEPKSQRSIYEHSQSTLQLPRKVKKGKSMKESDLQRRTQRLERNLKKIWECMGELWESSRITRYMSEKNQQRIDSLQFIQDQQKNLVSLMGPLLGSKSSNKIEKNIKKLENRNSVN